MSEANNPGKIVINLADVAQSAVEPAPPAPNSKIVILPSDVERGTRGSVTASPWSSPVAPVASATQTAASNRIVITPAAIEAGPSATACPLRQAKLVATFDVQRIVPLAVCTLGLGWGTLLFARTTNSSMQSAVFVPESGAAVIGVFLLAVSSLVLGTVAAFYFIRPADARSVPIDRFIQSLLFTATCGIVLLVLFQQFAMSEASARFHGHGKATGYFIVFRLIGWCYQNLGSANVAERLIAFIFGVGLCEEFTKLLPLFYFGLKRSNATAKTALTYRGFLLIGFFSGIGFGIGEALSCYSPWGMMHDCLAVRNVGRWFACVPSHGVYGMIDAAFLWYLLPVIKGAASAHAKAAFCALATAAAAVVHGVYDVLCSIEIMGPVMLAVALAVLVWVVLAVGKVRGEGESEFEDNRFASSPIGKLLLKLDAQKWIFPALYAAAVVLILLALGFSTNADAALERSAAAPTIGTDQQPMTEQQFMELLQREAAKRQELQQREGNHWMDNLGRCSMCGGEGYYRYVDANGVLQRRECPRCGGSGRGW